MTTHIFRHLALLLVLAGVLSGCGSRMEIEERAFVVVMGLDQAEGNDVSITYQIANPQVGSSDQANQSQEPASDIITFTAPDFLTGRDLANASIPRKLSFSHTKVLIIGEKLAKSEKFFSIIGATLREREMRREMNILVSREPAAEFIRSNSPKLETRPHKFFDFMVDRWQDTGLVPLSTVNRFFQRTESKNGLFLAIYCTTREYRHPEKGQEDEYLPGEIDEKGGNVTQMIGSAVFKNGKMIGALNGEETRFSLVMRSKSKADEMLVTYKDPLHPNYRIAARLLHPGRTHIKVDVKGERPVVKVTVPVNVDIMSIPSFENYSENFSKQELLRASLEHQLETKSRKLVKKMQTKYKGDPFMWELSARPRFLTLAEFQQYHWMERFPEANVTVDFQVKLREFGKQLRPPLKP
ncbi:hypothetical protein CBW65_04730 [Tumebacillus avium]|uniref:Uncharacterized protein n=1 Tax=Tumebacillus avium TaxID=1903704 RepID=A0A1Y0IIX7_9BACL|nr:Ger(x)C family spore germination protein [Tumebacillus avium]ARU60452.1 hypothetical protein CBW65_04730 [Tumebacillus avium]